MNKQRPVNLDLATVRFPVTAIASILHRICAVISWVGLGFLLFTLHYAMQSEANFDALSMTLQSNFLAQFIAWGLLTAFAYYCMGTVKHLIQDMGYFEDFEGGKTISWTAIGLGIVLSLLSGVLVWA